VSYPRRTVKDKSEKPASVASPTLTPQNVNKKFNVMGNAGNQYSGNFPCVEEKPNTQNFNFTSDQGSNSFDCSDFGLGDNYQKSPEISSLFSTAIETGETLNMEDGNGISNKKMKLDSGNAVAVEGHSGNSLSGVLSNADFESQLKLLDMQFLNENWAVDDFLAVDATQDGLSSIDLWSFADFPSVNEGIF